MAKKESTATDNNGRLVAYTVTEYTDKTTGEIKKRWIAIGAAFPHKNRDGYNIELDALPINAKIVLRAPLEKEQEAE